MNLISRRDMVRTSGLAIASPLLLPLDIHSQVPSVSGAASLPLTSFSKDVDNYVIDGASQVIAKIQNHALSPQDLRRAGSQFRFYARHIQSFESAIPSSGTSGLKSLGSLRTPKPLLARTQALLGSRNVDLSDDELNRYVPNLTTSGIPASTVGNYTHFSDVIYLLSDNFNLHADVMESAIGLGIYNPAAYQEGQSSSVAGIMHLENYVPQTSRAHLQHVCMASKTIKIPSLKDLCKALAAGGAASGSAAAWLQSGWSIFWQTITASSAADVAAASNAYVSAAPTVQLAVDALLFAEESSWLGPEGLVIGLAAIGVAATAFGLYCVFA